MAVVEIQDHSSLSELELGCSGQITDLDLSSEAIARLAGLGICEGRDVEIVRRGEPLVVRTCGSRIGIALSLARRIQVHAAPAT